MRSGNLLHWSVAILFLVFTACSSPQKESATLLIYGGTIYTVDTTQATVEAVAMKDNIILFAGVSRKQSNTKTNKRKLLDLEGKTMTPGLIEGHGHFMGLGYNEMNLDLMNTTSYQEIVDAVAETVKTQRPGNGSPGGVGIKANGQKCLR